MNGTQDTPVSTDTPNEPNTSNRPPRRLLMVTGIFPPHVIVGVIRTVKFCKFLPQFGWTPEILAYRPRVGLEEVDHTPNKDLPPGLVVHRINWLDLLAFPSRLKRRWRQRERAGQQLAADASAQTPATPALPVASEATSHGTGPSAWYRLFQNLPDVVAPWLPFAVLGGLRAARHCDCIYSSAPPFTVHLVAWFLHKLTGKPLVLDFRDPWIGNPTLSFVGRWHRRFHERWERRAVHAATHVINVTQTLEERMAARYPEEPRSKFVTIFNGVDDDELVHHVAGTQRTNPDEVLTFAYFGSLYNTRSPAPLFDAVRMLLDSGTINPGDIRVELVGPCRMDVASEVSRRRLEGTVKLLGKKPREWALENMGRAGVLLQIGSMQMDGHSLSTKIFEYLAAGRPILAMVPEGPIAAIVREMRAGRIASPDDPAKIAREIEAFVMEHKSIGIGPNPPCDLSRYSRRFQAEQLAGLLDAAVERRPARA